MPHSRPMNSIAPGVSELRARGADGSYRAFYYAAFAEGIIVFHAFVKKTQRTPESEMNLEESALRRFSMPKLKPTVAKTPAALAEALGLSAADAKEWQVQYELLKRLKGIVQREKITHAEIAKRAGTSRTRVTAILNDNLESVSSDLLIRVLGSLGYRVKVSVSRARSAA